MTEFNRTEKVNDRITAIRSLTGEIMYLIEGKDKAALIDTCLGVGHLKKTVEALTDRPITVLLTHGHLDHAMGAPEFETVYMNHADREVYEAMAPFEERNNYIRGNLGGKLPDFSPEDYVPVSPMNFHDLKDGDSFDLGGVHVDAYALAGHTKGTMVFLIREERIMVLGDACNPATFLFDKNSLTVEEYRKGLQEFQQRHKGSYDKVFLCHQVMELGPELVDNVIEVCDDILAGKTDDQPFEFMGQVNWIAKAVKEGFRRVDGKIGNIIYSKDRIKGDSHE